MVQMLNAHVKYLEQFDSFEMPPNCKSSLPIKMI